MPRVQSHGKIRTLRFHCVHFMSFIGIIYILEINVHPQSPKPGAQDHARIVQADTVSVSPLI